MMDYKERLRAFNSTEKYKKEIEFVKSLVNLTYSKVLDYGCGAGYFMEDAFVDGFDVNNYYEGSLHTKYHYCILPKRPYTDVTMIHSLAHIHNPTETLKVLKAMYNPKITVITPNRHWLMMQSNLDYKPDPTVVRHYTMTELRQLFKEAGYEVTLCGQFGEEANGINERIFLQAK